MNTVVRWLGTLALVNVDILAARNAFLDATGALSTTPFDERVPALHLMGIRSFARTGLSAPRVASHAAAAPEPMVFAVPAPPAG